MALDRVMVCIRDKKLDIHASFWLTHRQSDEYLRLYKEGVPDWEAMSQAFRNCPEDEDGVSENVELENKPI